MVDGIKEIHDISDLIPDDANPNEGTQRGRGLLENSLRTYGAGRSILADKHGRVIAGNKTLECAVDMGLQKVITVKTDGNTLVVVQRLDLDLKEDAVARALSVADNRIGEVNLSWSADVLQALADEQPEILDGLFTGDELTALLADLEPEQVDGAGGDEYDTTPQEGETRCKPGDLWQLGEHRLLCGDSTNPQHVERLMGGEKADMVFTDPPYNVAYGENANPRWRVRTIANDKHTDEDWAAFVNDWMSMLLSHCDGGIYICMSDKELPSVTDIFKRCGGHWSSYIIWVKDRFVLGLKDYHSRHETLLYGWRDGVKHAFYGGRTHDDAWDIPRPTSSEGHPTMKPIELVRVAVENSSKPHDIVYDPFLGSGTTLIAAERLGRKCCGLEIEPRYADVILRRWETETGKTAVLLSNA